ncbi:hypothetical protein ACFQ80_05720 [Isoptericola sp. NPDC056578]|uniref:hypothetical protein n=1 Tax=Isoptericola sp. NPDC056578 TaxID=3345870 RepID=UPI0036A62244
MLRRLAALAALIVPLALVAAPADAAGPVCKKHDDRTGICLIWATDDGSGDGNGDGGGSGGGDGGGDGGGSGGGGGGNPVAVTVDGRSCIYVGLADPQPPKSNPVWKGHKDGAIHVCNDSITGGSGGQLGGGPTQQILFWAASAPDAPPPPDPEDLAREAVASMGLHAIDIGIIPEDTAGSMGLVGLPTWMWAENPGGTTMGPITRTASAGGYTVTARAKVDKIVWNMGDGSSVTCTGPGTPYADEYDTKKSPDCGHTFTRQGEYAVTATSYWTVEWNGIGETGAIPLDFDEQTTIRIGESQVITQ